MRNRNKSANTPEAQPGLQEGEPLQQTSAKKARPKKAKQRTFKEDFAEMKKVGFWVALIISLPTLAVPTAVGKFISPGSMGGNEVETIYSTLVLTAPLTATVALLGLAILRGGLKDFLSGALVLVLALILTTVVSNYINDYFGLPSAVSLRAEAKRSPGLWSLLKNMLYSYYKAYGLWKFISSLAVGGFLAWAWSEKILPHLKKRKRVA